MNSHAWKGLFMTFRTYLIGLFAMVTATLTADPVVAEFASHPPQRPLPVGRERALGEGPNYYVDPNAGDDAGDGTVQRPWRSVNHAVRQLSPGDTLLLREGTYFENLYCAVAGTVDKPITIRAYPGELAIIDGGFREFQESPQTAWEPFEGGAEGEYRSTRPYKNIRDVVGLFGDSMIGLQTYWYLMDLRAENETWIPNKQTMIEPMYCGPGIYYDKHTGYIHARLAHTKLALPPDVDIDLVHYRGQTDPRKLPLVIAPFNATPLYVDQAMYVKFQDLVFRGGGYRTVDLVFGVGIEFDYCTIYCGTYGVWAKNTGPMKMTHCGVYGMIPPWAWRTENCSYAYSGSIYPPFVDGVAPAEIGGSSGMGYRETEPKRHIARLPTHAVLVTEGYQEFETFAHPFNHDWEIAYCEFTDGHDGVYLGGRDIHFHHNLVDNMQDDAIYVSGPTPYVADQLFIYQNLVRTCVAAFGGHARGGPGGDIYIFRNVIDMRKPLQFHRPMPKRPTGNVFAGHGMWLVHNPNHILHMENIHFYQNTAVVPAQHASGSYASGCVQHLHPDAERRVFNNLFIYTTGIGEYPRPKFSESDRTPNLAFDANLHWHAGISTAPDANFFLDIRNSPKSQANRDKYPAGWDANSVAADPRFVRFDRSRKATNDYRLQPNSPAIGAGIELPEQWPDPLRSKKDKAPDLGALPHNSEQLRVGIEARHAAGE